MIPRRMLVVAAVLVIVAIPVLTVLLVVGPRQQAAAQDDAARASSESVNAAQLLRIGRLQTTGSRISILQRQLAVLDQALPAKPELASLLSEIGLLTAAQHVTVVSFTTSGAQAAAATPAPVASASSTAAATPATTAAAGAAASTSSSGGVVSLPFDLQVTGTLDQVRDFVGALQRATRVVTVSGVTVTQGGTDPYTADITAIAYQLPASSSAATG